MTDEQRTEMSSNPSQPAHIFRFVISHRKDRTMPLALAEQSCTPVAPAPPPTQEGAAGYRVQAHQEDQGAARERLHYGGKARLDRGPRSHIARLKPSLCHR